LWREITSSIGLGIKAPEGFPGFTTVTSLGIGLFSFRTFSNQSAFLDIIVTYASKTKYYQIQLIHNFFY
jgi:hypothetical protein